MSDRFSYTIEDAIAYIEDVYALTLLESDRGLLQHLKEFKEIKDNLAHAEAQTRQEHRDRVRDRRGA